LFKPTGERCHVDSGFIRDLWTAHPSSRER
jgi:hypothetical protein